MYNINNNIMGEFEKLQKDIQKSKSKAKVLNPQDNLEQIKQKLGGKYVDDLSDSDDNSDDELSTYKERHDNFIKKNVKTKPQKTVQKPQMIAKQTVNKKNKIVSDKSSVESSKESKGNNESETVDDTEQDSETETDGATEDISINEYEYKDEFVKLIKTYVTLDNEVRELRLKAKELNSKKDTTQIEIMKHLERLGDNYVKINGGALRINQYESKGGLKEDLIKEAIQDKVKNPKITEEILEIINDKRETNKKVQKSLKRTYERGKK